VGSYWVYGIRADGKWWRLGLHAVELTASTFGATSFRRAARSITHDV
jgi:hypothetical protein